MTLKIYSAAEHSFSFLGIPIENGFGEDEFLSWEQKEPNFTHKSGVDGEGTRSENKNTYTEVKLTLMQTSSSNAVLSVILNTDTKVPGGSGIGPLMARDRQGTTTFMSAEAYIVGPPAQKRGKEVGMLEWTFGCQGPVRLDGGS